MHPPGAAPHPSLRMSCPCSLLPGFARDSRAGVGPLHPCQPSVVPCSGEGAPVQRPTGTARRRSSAGAMRSCSRLRGSGVAIHRARQAPRRSIALNTASTDFAPCSRVYARCAQKATSCRTIARRRRDGQVSTPNSADGPTCKATWCRGYREHVGHSGNLAPVQCHEERPRAGPCRVGRYGLSARGGAAPSLARRGRRASEPDCPAQARWKRCSRSPPSGRASTRGPNLKT